MKSFRRQNPGPAAGPAVDTAADLVGRGSLEPEQLAGAEGEGNRRQIKRLKLYA
jgi:hypothetical protein